MFMIWLKEQLYHFNVLGDFVIVIIVVTFSRMNTNREIKTLRQEIKKDTAPIRNNQGTTRKKRR